MPAYNEQDVIYHAIEALVSEGVDVYLIDHASTDGTADAARPWLGRGLVHIERFPEEAGYAERNQREMVWRDILRRVQEVSGERGADWYLFVNADEFREAPWPGVTLAEGLREVDELGYNAVNFELFDFRAIDDSFVDGEDVRYFLRHYEPPGRYNLLQVKAWKRQEQPVDIVTHGGHDLLFAGKCVFPVPFILRHYPIRSSAHGRRKVLGERLPRFAAEERAGGWHVQYDHYGKDSDYLHDPATLAVWDASRARAELLARTLQTLLLSLCLGGAKPTGHGIDGAALVGWLTRRGLPPASAVELQQAQERLALAARGTPAPGDDPAVDLIARDLSVALEANASVAGNPLLARQLAEAREALAGGAPARELAASV
jgi:glycosyltransferase involved in cell wall biosynthesis